MTDFWKHTEGRRLEFKGEMSAHSDMAKTVVAFANDAGGDIYIGIDNKHNIVGLPEEGLTTLEEQLSNMVYDRCYPAILPEITFLTIEDKHIIADLERKRRNISFDSEIVLDKPFTSLDFNGFVDLFEEKTGEDLNVQTLRKLELIREEQGTYYPTNALVLFSDDDLRRSLFPNAKIECARFKGVSTEEFIDQKTIDCNIGLQAEEAYNFVLRHINKGASIQGVYTVSRWEYPVKAIREIIRNACVHRQYSLTGKDIKVAIYDDMIEVTSPGLLPPSIDYSAMESRQSDARNKVIAPVFKKLGIIDQWGNGLKLVAEELKEYPEIEMRWQEIGLSFQVQFIKKNYISDNVGDNVGDRDAKEAQILSMISQDSGISAAVMAEKLGITKRHCERIIAKMKSDGLISREGSVKNGKWIITKTDK